MESKTRAAVRWINGASDRTQYAAAKKFDVSQSAISIALQKQAKNIHLWNTHKSAIELKESTGDGRHAAHIPVNEMIGALRGRDALKQQQGRGSAVLQYPQTRADDALDLIDSEGLSVRDAAMRCEISVPAVYASKKVREKRQQSLVAVGVDVCDRVEKYAADNPNKTAEDIAQHFDLTVKGLREAMTARATSARCALAGGAPKGYFDGFAACRAQAAMLAETIGGEYGAHVAAAIRGLV